MYWNTNTGKHLCIVCMLNWLSFFAGSLFLTPGGGVEKLPPTRKIVTELINFDDFVKLAVLRPADVHRPDLVRVAHLWPH